MLRARLFLFRLLKADFHSAFFVARATFLLFKLNSFPLQAQKTKDKKKRARDILPQTKS